MNLTMYAPLTSDPNAAASALSMLATRSVRRLSRRLTVEILYCGGFGTWLDVEGRWRDMAGCG